MGCSSFREEVNQEDVRKILELILKIEKFIKKFENDLSIDQIKIHYIREEFYFINKFWFQDFLNHFEYNEIINEKNKIIDKLNIDISQVNEKGIINRISVDQTILEILRGIIFVKTNISKLITNNRAKNNIVSLKKGKAKIPDINTILIKPELFDDMFKILLDIYKIGQDIIKNDLTKEEVVIANRQIYIGTRSQIDHKINLLISFIEDNNLRTKYFISFDNAKDFQEIIDNYIIDNKLEKYIISHNYNTNEIKEEDLKFNRKKIGTILNLIKKEKKNDLSYEKNSKGKSDDYSDLINENENINNKKNNKNNNKITNINIKINEIGKNNINNQNRNSINSNQFYDQFIPNSNSNIINININNIHNNINNNIPNNEQNLNNYDININNIDYSSIKRIKKIKSNLFINEFLQSLANVDILTKLFIKKEKKITEENKKFSPSVKRFINTLKLIYNIDLNPNNKLLDEEYILGMYNKSDNNFDINISFITSLFNKFKEELSDMPDLNLNNMLFGERRISFECNSCKKSVDERQEFCYFQFNLYVIFHYYKNLNKDIKSINIKDCFNYIKNNDYSQICPFCKSEKIKDYSVSYYDLPQIIIIILENGEENKLTKNLYFSSDALLERDDDKEYYELISEIHKLKNNDFISLLKSEKNNKWYICQGNNIEEYEKHKFDDSALYLLIYKKVDDISQEKYIDELDRTIDKDEKLDLIFYSTVSKIREKVDNLEYDMKIEEVFKELSRKYSFENRTILLFNNSRRIQFKNTIKESNLKNNDIIIIVEHNFSRHK